MSYSVLSTDGYEPIYISSDNKRSCIGIDPVLQEWLWENKDGLPNDIQAQVAAGTLTLPETNPTVI